MAKRRLLYGALMLLIALIAGAQTYGHVSAGSVGGVRSLSNLHAGGEREQRDATPRSAGVPGFVASPAASHGSVGTVPAAPAAPSNLQLIADSGFEDGTGTLAWHQASTAGLQLIDQFDAHTGTWDGDLCGYQGCNPDVLWQQFTVPGGITAATLTFWVAAYCPPNATASCNASNNEVIFRIIDQSNNFVAAGVSGSGPPNSVATYARFSLDAGSFLSSRGGQPIQVQAIGVNQAGDFGGFFIDDVTLTANDPPQNVTATSSAPGTVGVTWSPPPDATTNGVTAYAVKLLDSKRNVVASNSVASSPDTFTSLTNGVPYYAEVAWINPDVTGAAADSYSVTPFSGLAAPTAMTAVSTSQYVLPNSDGAAWQRMDETNLSFQISPGSTENVLLSANADLWTWNAGYNQDIGIQVTPGAGSPVIAAWKESGGFAGTFSPNAAFVETVFPMSSGTTYRVDLVWKSNKSAMGASVSAGAGPISAAYSPTRLSARVLPTGSQSAESNTQYSFVNSDGVTWQPVDSAALQFSFTPSATASYVISGNADMWTWNAGLNQDLAINVSPACGGQSSTLAAWKESGGFAGTFSPNAAFVQTVCPMNSGTSYTVTLEWKTNKPSGGGKITIGAGPPSAPFSPTSLTAYPLAASSGTETWDTDVSTTQYTLANNDGATWVPMDAAHLASASPLNPGGTETVFVSANSDLWTSSAGYNQDIAVFVSVDGGTATLLAWKESGGFGGTFSPNAAFLQTEYTMSAGHTYTFTIAWKANKNASGATIWAGAGNGPYSPTRLTVVPLS